MEKEFVKVRSFKDVAISISLIIAGTVIAVLPVSVSLNITGYVLLFTGIFLFFTVKSAYMYSGSGKIYRKKEKYFSQGDKEMISRVFTSRTDEIAELPPEDKASSVRLDIYYNEKEGQGFARMYEYVPYQYVPASPLYECSLGRIQKLLK